MWMNCEISRLQCLINNIILVRIEEVSYILVSQIISLITRYSLHSIIEIKFQEFFNNHMSKNAILFSFSILKLLLTVFQKRQKRNKVWAFRPFIWEFSLSILSYAYVVESKKASMNRLEDWLRWAQTTKTDLLFWENLPGDCRNHDVLTTPLSYSHMTIIFGRMPSIETKFVKSFEGIRMEEREYESKCDVPDDETNCGFSPSSIGRTRSIFLPEIFCRHTFLKSCLLLIHKRDVTYKVLRNIETLSLTI